MTFDARILTYKQRIKELETSRRRSEREEQKRQKELQRRAKESAKLTALEQARLEVETYENTIDLLLSVHKDCGEVWDWRALASVPPPMQPARQAHAEFKARRTAIALSVRGEPLKIREQAQVILDKAHRDDESELREATDAYHSDLAEWEHMKALAMRILNNDGDGFIEALQECSPLSEIGHLGSSMVFTAHGSQMMECLLRVNGTQAIPAEAKTLTAAGKVSVKRMPKTRFQEIYQDYVCGCALRVAREVFALLPIKMLIVTAIVKSVDPKSGADGEIPVLSVAFPRERVQQLFYPKLDPSDAMDNFVHRGDVKASRKGGVFESIIPLTPADVPVPAAGGYEETMFSATTLREQIAAESGQFARRATCETTMDEERT